MRVRGRNECDIVISVMLFMSLEKQKNKKNVLESPPFLLFYWVSYAREGC
jgi:hypothetical protein